MHTSVKEAEVVTSAKKPDWLESAQREAPKLDKLRWWDWILASLPAAAWVIRLSDVFEPLQVALERIFK